MLKKFHTIDLSVDLPTVIKSLEQGVIELQDWTSNLVNQVDPYEKELLLKHIEMYQEAIELYKTKGRYAGLNYLHVACREMDVFEQQIQYKRAAVGYADGLREWDD